MTQAEQDRALVERWEACLTRPHAKVIGPMEDLPVLIRLARRALNPSDHCWCGKPLTTGDSLTDFAGSPGGDGQTNTASCPDHGPNYDPEILEWRVRVAEKRVGELEEGLRDLLRDYDEEGSCIQVLPVHWCPECTSGVTPDKYWVGPCPYHKAKALLARGGDEAPIF